MVNDPLEIGLRLGRNNATDSSLHRWANRTVLSGDLLAMRRRVTVCVGESCCASVIGRRHVPPLVFVKAVHVVAVVDGVRMFPKENKNI